MIWFFLISRLFLGWSLGANDTANVFGTAVGTRMIKFKFAATVVSIFVILGAVFSRAGTTRTLEQLGAVNAMGGSFTVALCAGDTVAWMTRLELPVSTSQAIVRGIIGWNFFTSSPTNYTSFINIVLAWITSPILAVIVAIVLFKIFKLFIDNSRIHLLELDMWTCSGLILVGAFGAYSLGANNIANVMGVFVSAVPFNDIHPPGLFTVSGKQQLFLSVRWR